MSMSDSGAPPPPTRKMVLRKIPKEVSFASATPEAPAHAPKSRLPEAPRVSPAPPPLPAAARAARPPGVDAYPSQAVPSQPAPSQPAASQPPAGSAATPLPSRISVLPFVAPIPSPVTGRPAEHGGPPRYVLIVAGIALSGVLVGAGILLGARLDGPTAQPSGLGAQKQAAASLSPTAESPRGPPAQAPTPANPLVATANVNDLPRVPAPMVRRWTPPQSAAAVRSPPPRAATAAPSQAAASQTATGQNAETSESASGSPAAATPSAASATPAPSTSSPGPATSATIEEPAPKPAPSATAQAQPTADPTPSAPADPLLEEIKKAVGGSQHK